MGVDRGMGILWDVFTVSGHSVNWDEILEWYLDGPGSSFKESDEFIPGPPGFILSLTLKNLQEIFLCAFT